MARFNSFLGPVTGPLRPFLGVIVLLAGCGAVQASENGARESLGVFESEAARFRIDVVARGLEIPSSMAFLPDGRALVTERRLRRISLIDLASGEITPLSGLPAGFGHNGGGTLDVILHPDYATNGWIYFAYSIGTEQRNTLAVDRAHLQGTKLVGRQRLFEAHPFAEGDNHPRTRLVIQDGYLFFAMGERYDLKEKAQELDNHLGKIIRIHDDGRVPEDNPFIGVEGALPEIWSYGHRNPQGLALHPKTGALWQHEHGPQGGDEINIIRPGLNYGWPVITFGEEYGGGPISDGITAKEGMEPPLYYYVPSIAPSGMEFYTGDAFPGWRENIFLGALAFRHLNRLVIEGEKIIREERLLEGRDWIVRMVEQGPGGMLYIGVDDGMILRLSPVD